MFGLSSYNSAQSEPSSAQRLWQTVSPPAVMMRLWLLWGLCEAWMWAEYVVWKMCQGPRHCWHWEREKTSIAVNVFLCVLQLSSWCLGKIWVTNSNKRFKAESGENRYMSSCQDIWTQHSALFPKDIHNLIQCVLCWAMRTILSTEWLQEERDREKESEKERERERERGRE